MTSGDSAQYILLGSWLFYMCGSWRIHVCELKELMDDEWGQRSIHTARFVTVLYVWFVTHSCVCAERTYGWRVGTALYTCCTVRDCFICVVCNSFLICGSWILCVVDDAYSYMCFVTHLCMWADKNDGWWVGTALCTYCIVRDSCINLVRDAFIRVSRKNS